MIVNLFFYFVIYPFFFNMFIFYLHDSIVKEISNEGYAAKNCPQLAACNFLENALVAIIPLFNLASLFLVISYFFPLLIQLIAVKNKQEKE